MRAAARVRAASVDFTVTFSESVGGVGGGVCAIARLPVIGPR